MSYKGWAHASTVPSPKHAAPEFNLEKMVDNKFALGSPRAKLLTQMLKSGISLENATRYAEKIERKGLVSHEQVDVLLARQKRKYPDVQIVHRDHRD